MLLCTMQADKTCCTGVISWSLWFPIHIHKLQQQQTRMEADIVVNRSGRIDHTWEKRREKKKERVKRDSLFTLNLTSQLRLSSCGERRYAAPPCSSRGHGWVQNQIQARVQIWLMSFLMSGRRQTSRQLSLLDCGGGFSLHNWPLMIGHEES